MALMPRRWMIWTVAAILLLGGFPVLTLLLAVLFASAFGCGLDEGSVHPCVVLGRDFGEFLYAMAVGGWFALVTIPLAGLALIAWLIALVVSMLIKRGRGTDRVDADAAGGLKKGRS